MAQRFDFGDLRDHLGGAIAELEARLATAARFGDDSTTLAWRQHVTFFTIARSFADALDKQASATNRWHVEHGIAVLRLEDQ